MATIRLSFRPAAEKGEEGKLYYSISHFGRGRNVDSGFKIMASEWDFKRSRVKVGNAEGRAARLRFISESVAWVLAKARQLIFDMGRKGGQFDIAALASAVNEWKGCQSLFRFLQLRVIKLEEVGAEGTAECCKSLLSSLRRFRGGEDICICSLDNAIMKQYERYLSGCGVCRNTSSRYMRTFRTAYNAAVAKGYASGRDVFHGVYCGYDKTRKRAIGMKCMSDIVKLDLSASPALDFARDMFVFSFCMRGMSFVDMAYLKKSDLKDGQVTYVRRKTRRTMTVKWEKEMQCIVDKWSARAAGTTYMLPIIVRQDRDARRQYLSAYRKVNNSLKRIAQLIRLDVNLTTYVARHTWASAAHQRRYPILLISEALGHESVQTTMTYIEQISLSDVDDANRELLACLGEGR